MSVEERVKAAGKRKHIQDILVRSLYVAGAIGLAVTVPNAVQLLRYVEKYIGDAPRLDRRISQATTRLVAKDLLVRTRGGGLKLTEKGRRLAEALEVIERARSKPLRWDGKWRIVIFDIWERRRSVRDRLRIILEKNGFKKIQNSVWVYPYNCEELFAFVRANLSLGKGILYIIAEEIEHDGGLRKHFGLHSS